MGVKDNFIINMPLLALFGVFFHPGRTLLFIEASCFAVINFLFFYYAALYFLRKCKIEISFMTLMPILWLASFGYNFALLYMNTNWRDFEVGLSFIYFMLALKLYYGEVSPFKSWKSKLLTIFVVVAAGILMYSYPYFLYLTAMPIVFMFLALFVLRKVGKDKVLLVISGLVFAVVIDRVMKTLMAYIGLFTPHGSDASFISFSNVFKEMANSLSKLSTIFGTNISGDRLVSLPAAAALLNLILVFAVALWVVALLITHFRESEVTRSKRPSPLLLITIFFGALFALVFVANAVSTQDDYRYFVLSIFLVGMLTALSIGTLKRRGTFFFVLIWLATVINIATAVFAYTPLQSADAAYNLANSGNFQVIDTMKQLGLTKGYTNYWDGNINTYLSGGSVSFLPVTCAFNTITQPLYLLVDTAQFNQDSSKSFYMIDPSMTSPPTCGERQIIAQFGKPNQAVYVAGKQVLIYNYDIGSRMQAK